MDPKPTAEDLKPIVEQLEDDLKKLKGLLEALSNQSATGVTVQPSPEEEEGEPTGPPLERSPVRAAMTETAVPVKALEPEEFIHMVEVLLQDAETTDRLTKVERQSRRLTILGAIILAILLVAIVIMIVLMMSAGWFDKLS